MEKITFCIPSKNNKRYLEACIPSIRKNSFRDDHDIIVFVDEDFTSKEASQMLIMGGMKKSKRKEKGALDKVAASLILERYLAMH